MSNWQLIETAPKDGTLVLVWFRGGYHVARYASLWHPDNKRWLVNTPKWTDEDMQIVTEIQPDEYQARLGWVGPTHWIALPEPPMELNTNKS